MNLTIKLLFLSLAIIPVFGADGISTVVALSDADLNELLQIVFSQLSGSTLISITLLESLGLNTPSVISLLQKIGYTILF
jgi:hypothetical protein